MRQSEPSMTKELFNIFFYPFDNRHLKGHNDLCDHIEEAEKEDPLQQ